MSRRSSRLSSVVLSLGALGKPSVDSRANTHSTCEEAEAQGSPQRGSSWAVYLRKPLKARRYQGHVPGVAFSFGSPYGTTTLKYFQEQRNAEKSHTAFRKGGHFPTSLSPNPNQVLSDRSRTRDHWLYAPSCTRFNLDSSRAAELSRFYQSASVCFLRAPEPAGNLMTQQHREYYQDKTGMAPRVPYFVLPVREWERYPTPTDL
ncbi:UPF0573 protein C2orf70, partial [Eschrichtius robustus]|nr:UPF0573 protein C2orf70 [Eschrichtius robustus]